MEGNAPSSYCERCGIAASIDAGTLYSCLQCDRFICTDCWDARRQRCADCAPRVLRASRARDLTLLRRVDRRLREVVRDATAVPGKVRASNTSTIAAEIAFLRLKASNAGKIGEETLARRVRGAKATQVEAFASRIRRHIRLAYVAVARAERQTRAEPDDRATEAMHPRRNAPGRGWRRRVAVAAAVAAAALVAVVLTRDLDVGLLAGREGVLGGLLPDGSPVPSGTGGGTAPSSPVAGERVSLAFDFNAVRMGHGIGDVWDGDPSPPAAESIQVAAFPTSFDRSARLTSYGGQSVGACAAVEPQELERIAFDVYLDPARPAVGTLSLYSAGDDAQLEIVIDAEDPLSARVPEGELTPGPRIAAGGWRRVELIAEAGELRWTVGSLAEPTTAPAEGSLGPAVLAPITRICLAADGPSGGAVSYDNLEIHGTTSGG